ncbi:MAG: type II secretion system protein [bacterium]|nr:type II secretion system protein [bacterium]
MKKGFTLAEVLITLAIIGVVAAVSIPSVISNSQQQEFKTGLRKAVSVLNSAITMNMALDGETPYDNANLFGFLMKHMAVMESVTDLRTKYAVQAISGNAQWSNAAFYTTDGMRFELRAGNKSQKHKLYESDYYVCYGSTVGDYTVNIGQNCNGCGSLGLNNNTDNTTKTPCLVTVDVNGDRKPNPANINCKDTSCAKPYKFSDPEGKRLVDMFTIMITDKEAIPYGVAAQKAMYQSQK